MNQITKIKNFLQHNTDQSNVESKKWSFILILASAICCLGSALPAGYNIGVMNNAAQVRNNYIIDLLFFQIKMNNQIIYFFRSCKIFVIKV